MKDVSRRLGGIALLHGLLCLGIVACSSDGSVDAPGSGPGLDVEGDPELVGLPPEEQVPAGPLSAELEGDAAFVPAAVVSRPPYLPVIPGAAGFGMATRAGRGGRVIKVTNLNDSGTGSLRACVDVNAPRVCVFEVSGTIQLRAHLTVRHPFLTIAGQTAPSPGILLRGYDLLVHASDVLVQHLRFRIGDSQTGIAFENRDAFDVEHAEGGVTENVIIDHCSFSWAVDETATAWQRWNNVTLSNNIFSEALADSFHPKGPHSMGILAGPSDNSHISITGNLLAHNNGRNPMMVNDNWVFANNLVYNWGNQPLVMWGRVGPVRASIIGNVYKRGPNSSSSVPFLFGAGADQFPTGTRIYIADNAYQGAIPADQWSLTKVAASATNKWNYALAPGGPSDYRTTTSQSIPAGLGIERTANNAVYNSVLARAGARPRDRDPVDTRLVSNVRNGTGRIVNCVSADGSTRCERNAGGWPTLANNRRTLTVPADPNGDADGDGYTNVEEWLHSYARAVEEP